MAFGVAMWGGFTFGSVSVINWFFSTKISWRKLKKNLKKASDANIGIIANFV